jgi:hypothetical protein
MQRSPDEVLQSHEALSELSPDVLASALIVALLESEKDLAVSILTMVAVASKMAKYLPVDLRTRFAWHLAEVMSELGARWN